MSVEVLAAAPWLVLQHKVPNYSSYSPNAKQPQWLYSAYPHSCLYRLCSVRAEQGDEGIKMLVNKAIC